MLLFLQETPEVLEAISDEKTLSIYKLIVDGGLGGQIIISILFVLLTVSLYIYFERFFAIKAASKVDKNFMNQIKDYVSNGKLDAATVLCKKTNSPTARLIEKGISRIGKPLEDINKAIENAGKLEVYQLEKNVSVIATIAGAAPMIGFLGTVLGMMSTFHQMAQGGSGGIKIEDLSEGIMFAMTTTVAGLIVGIIAYVGYNLLVGKVDKVVHDMENKSMEFMDLLHQPTT